MSDDKAVEDFEKFLDKFDAKMKEHKDYVERVRMQREIVEVERKHVWNAAIEAAAKVCDKYDSYGAAYEIRKVLKK